MCAARLAGLYIIVRVHDVSSTEATVGIMATLFFWAASRMTGSSRSASGRTVLPSLVRANQIGWMASKNATFLTTASAPAGSLVKTQPQRAWPLALVVAGGSEGAGAPGAAGTPVT